jgi:hypothetical protein
VRHACLAWVRLAQWALLGICCACHLALELSGYSAQPTVMTIQRSTVLRVCCVVMGEGNPLPSSSSSRTRAVGHTAPYTVHTLVPHCSVL